MRDNPSPPRKLPTGYRPVWERVSALDRELRSRRLLAHRLGLSTHTLQRLLVRGDVPRLDRDANPRVRRSWIGIVTRLADHFGIDPREWLDGLGVTWTGSVPDVVQAARARPAAVESPAAIEVRVPGGGALDLAEGTSGGFASRLATRLVRSVWPDADLRVRSEAGAILTGVASSTGPTLEVGRLDTPSARAAGDTLLPIPGLRVRTGVVVVGPLPLAPTWDRLTIPGADGCTWRVPRSSPHHDHLRIHDEVRTDAVSVIDGRDVDELADGWTAAGEPTWLVTDALTATGVRDRLAGTGTEARLEVLVDPAAPTFPLAIGVRAAASVGSLLAHAHTDALFGSAAHATGRLYADLLTLLWARCPSGTEGPDGSRAPITLDPFEGASPVFRNGLVTHLVARMALALHPLRFVRGVPRDLAAARREAHFRAWTHARAMVPVAWVDEVRATAAERDLGERACASCSSSIQPGVNASAAPGLCLHCTDDAGRLRPRPELEAVMTRWLRGALPMLDEATASSRASELLDRGQAWRSAS